MGNSKEYIGISLEEDVIKIARVGYVKKQLEIIRLDKLKLVKPTQKKLIRNKLQPTRSLMNLMMQRN